MRDQGYITAAEYAQDVQDPLPTQDDLTPPQERSESPYFTSWVRQQVVDHFGPFRAFSGNLQITHLARPRPAAGRGEHDRADAAAGVGPAVGGARRDRQPDGRGARDGRRRRLRDETVQPRDAGPAPARLDLQAVHADGALKDGISPGSVWTSQPKRFVVPHSGGREFFVVRNYGDEYSGSNTLAGATTVSDNSVYAEVGIKVGTKKIARLARKLGVRTPISTNYAMILGGLRNGVTPLDMAHAYETFATGGKRLWNPKLGAPDKGPIGIHLVRDGDGKVLLSNPKTLKRKQVIPESVASEVRQILETVVAYGTGKQAAIPGVVAGKTGTTENYGDAWFVGWNDQLTVAIWVGYPDRLVPMLTQFGGSPVAGGTYPAMLWHNFMEQAIAIFAQRAATAEALRNGQDPSSVDMPGGSVDSAPTGGDTSGTGDTGVPAGGTGGGTGGETGGGTTGGTGGTGGDTGGGGTGTPPAGGDTGAPAPPAGGGGGGGGGGTGTPAPPAGGGDANGGGAAAPSG